MHSRDVRALSAAVRALRALAGSPGGAGRVSADGAVEGVCRAMRDHLESCEFQELGERTLQRSARAP